MVDGRGVESPGINLCRNALGVHLILLLAGRTGGWPIVLRLAQHRPDERQPDQHADETSEGEEKEKVGGEVGFSYPLLHRLEIEQRYGRMGGGRTMSRVEEEG